MDGFLQGQTLCLPLIRCADCVPVIFKVKQKQMRFTGYYEDYGKTEK